MSILLSLGLAFLGTSGALWVSRRLGRKPDGTPAEPEAPDADEVSAKKEVDDDLPARADDSTPKLEPEKKKRPRRTPTATKPSSRIDGFACQLGDVLMRITGEEAWLAGGIVLAEEVPVAVLWVAPDAGHDVVIYVRPNPRPGLMWLEPLEPSAILVGGEPPSSVEHEGIRFERARKLPLRPRRVGVGAPDVGDAVTVAEYASTGTERLLVLKATNGLVHAYRGHELEDAVYEIIASGETTLE